MKDLLFDNCLSWGEAILRVCELEPGVTSREPRATSLFFRAEKDSRQKIQKTGIMP